MKIGLVLIFLGALITGASGLYRELRLMEISYDMTVNFGTLLIGVFGLGILVGLKENEG